MVSPRDKLSNFCSVVVISPRATSHGHPIRRSKFVVDDIPRIPCLRRLEQNYLSLRISHGSMFDPARNNAKVSRLQSLPLIPKLNGHLTPPNEEHFILALMMMPWKYATEFHQLDFLPI